MRIRPWIAAGLSILVLAGLCLFTAAQAGAHRTNWYWNRYKAEYELLAYGLEWEDEFDEVYFARCYGHGNWIRLNERGHDDRHFGFRHFRCRISADDSERYWIVFHVTGRDVWTPVFLRWA